MGKKRREKLERRKTKAAAPAQANTGFRLTTTTLIIAIVVVVAAGLAAGYGLAHQRAALTGASGPAAAPSPGTWFKSQGHQGHNGENDAFFAHFKYSSNPPTSGAHKELMADALINSKPLAKFLQVHLLEHGNVLLQYHCFSCPDVVAALDSIAHRFNDRLMPSGQAPSAADISSAEEQGEAVIVAPNNDMDAKIALTAWTRLETLDTPDQRAIVDFINAYLHNQDNLKQ